MKKLIYSAIGLIGLGFILMVMGFVLSGGKLSSFQVGFTRDDDYTKETVSDVTVIDKVEIQLKTRNVSFALNEDESYRVEYYQSERDNVLISVTDGIMKIEEEKPKFQLFFWGFRSRQVATVVVVLPKDFTGEIAIRSDTGEIHITALEVLEKLSVEVKTGKVLVSNLTVNSPLKIQSSTGTVEISNLVAPSLGIKVSTGKIVLNDTFVTGEATLGSSTGNITITGIQSVSLNCRAPTGKIIIENTLTDTLKAEASTGSVSVKLIGKAADYRLNVHSDTGSVKFQGEKYGSSLINPVGSKSITVSTSTGNISINISE
ncbi:MAG: DUF4097 family beta strand repeat-containing protein [Bacilli bacterium]|nr:DUF4097 family beta strand repeat-containing protein [Bacilli bacterium]